MGALSRGCPGTGTGFVCGDKKALELDRGGFANVEKSLSESVPFKCKIAHFKMAGCILCEF